MPGGNLPRVKMQQVGGCSPEWFEFSALDSLGCGLGKDVKQMAPNLSL
jgi:hypothetical protein